MKFNREYVAPTLLIGMSVIGFVAFAKVATERPLTELEGVLLQAFSVSMGFIGTFMIGRQSARSAAMDIIKPHARSAFRRLLSQYQSLRRMATIVESSQGSEAPDQYEQALARLGEIAIAQISTADDALSDWEDIVPEDVMELRRLSSKRPRRGG
jgi:hypothetical protein